MLMVRWAAGLLLSLTAATALAIPIPQNSNTPIDSGSRHARHAHHRKRDTKTDTSAATGEKASTPAAPPPAGQPAAPALVVLKLPPPPSPAAPATPPGLHTLLRGQPPQRAATSSSLAVGQTWSVTVTSSDGPNCNGAIRIDFQDNQQAFSGPATLTCSQTSAVYSFQQDASLIDDGDDVIVSLSHATGDSRAPHWQTLHLLRESPNRMTGTSADEAGSSAFTLDLQTH